MDRPPLVFEGFASLGSYQNVELIIGDASSSVKVDAIELVLLGAIADSGHVADPATTQDVEHDHLFSQSNWVIQGKQ